MRPANVALVLTLRDGGVVDLWQRDGRTAGDLVDILRQVADGFENGDARRIG